MEARQFTICLCLCPSRLSQSLRRTSIIFACLVLILKQSLPVQPWMVCNLLCRPGEPEIFTDPHASASREPELKMGATILGRQMSGHSCFSSRITIRGSMGTLRPPLATKSKEPNSHSKIIPRSGFLLVSEAWRDFFMRSHFIPSWQKYGDRKHLKNKPQCSKLDSIVMMGEGRLSRAEKPVPRKQLSRLGGVAFPRVPQSTSSILSSPFTACQRTQ